MLNFTGHCPPGAEEPSFAPDQSSADSKASSGVMFSLIVAIVATMTIFKSA